MPRPVLLAVDDDPDVLRAVERDLRKQYSDRYRVMSADSGPKETGPRPLVQRWTSGGLPINGGFIKVSVRCANQS